MGVYPALSPKMTRTYVKGRWGYKRTDHKHGHCVICGYEPGLKGRKRTEQKRYMKFHVLPYIKMPINSINDIIKKQEVYVLLADGDGTMRSSNEPFGVAVTTKEEAKRFIKDGGVGYTHSYSKLTIFENKDEAIKWRFSRT